MAQSEKPKMTNLEYYARFGAILYGGGCLAIIDYLAHPLRTIGEVMRFLTSPVDTNSSRPTIDKWGEWWDDHFDELDREEFRRSW